MQPVCVITMFTISRHWAKFWTRIINCAPFHSVTLRNISVLFPVLYDLLVNKFPDFYATSVCVIAMFTILRHWTKFWTRIINCAPFHSVTLRNILILLPVLYDILVNKFPDFYATSVCHRHVHNIPPLDKILNENNQLRTPSIQLLEETFQYYSQFTAISCVLIAKKPSIRHWCLF